MLANRDEEKDNKVMEIFNRNMIGCAAIGYFIHSNTEMTQERNIGYKLHVNVSEKDVMNFLEEAIPILGRKGAAFKIWKPSLIKDQVGTQQGKLVTIYAESRTEAIDIISALEPVLKKYAPGPMPPNEKQLSPFISYRYADFSDKVLHNPWNPNEVITGDEGRSGKKEASWVRGLEEKPKLVSRFEVVEEEKAKIGDIVALLNADENYVPAELVDFRLNPNKPELTAQAVDVRFFDGVNAGKIFEVGLQNISREPGEKSKTLSVLEKLLNSDSRLVSRNDIINDIIYKRKGRRGDIVAFLDSDGNYVPAELMTDLYDPVSIPLKVLVGPERNRIINLNIDNISNSPYEKLNIPKNILLDHL